jgi:hypothetical protein
MLAQRIVPIHAQNSMYALISMDHRTAQKALPVSFAMGQSNFSLRGFRARR